MNDPFPTQSGTSDDPIAGQSNTADKPATPVPDIHLDCGLIDTTVRYPNTRYPELIDTSTGDAKGINPEQGTSTGGTIGVNNDPFSLQSGTSDDPVAGQPNTADQPATPVPGTPSPFPDPIPLDPDLIVTTTGGAIGVNPEQSTSTGGAIGVNPEHLKANQ